MQTVVAPEHETPHPDGAPLWLDADQLHAWKALWAMLVRLPAAVESQLQRDSGLTAMDYYVLAVLSEEPGRSMRMGELARLACASPSRLSHLVRRLEGEDLLRRAPDCTDGRFTLAVLTERGLEALVAAAPGHVCRVRSLVVDALDPAALRALADGAQRILAQLDTLSCVDRA